jgi:hypothetical protein
MTRGSLCLKKKLTYHFLSGEVLPLTTHHLRVYWQQFSKIRDKVVFIYKRSYRLNFLTWLYLSLFSTYLRPRSLTRHSCRICVTSYTFGGWLCWKLLECEVSGSNAPCDVTNVFSSCREFSFLRRGVFVTFGLQTIFQVSSCEVFVNIWEIAELLITNRYIFENFF